MNILMQSEIQKAIAHCKPLKIAVAYIGADWNTFIPNTHCLEAIIISPTFGTNPRAVIDLVRNIGWEKVFFLDSLHAKAYVGETSAVVGSANLTNNGLSGEGLVELCVEFNSNENLCKVNQFFANLMEDAQEQYPTIEKKKARLKELERTWDALIANGTIKRKQKIKRTFSEFELLGNDHFYVLWFQPVDCEYSEDVKAINSFMTDDIHFSKKDKVQKNKWALVWRITDSNKPHASVKPHWLYIHEVIENGVIDEDYDYPKCAIQRNDMEVPSPPFELMPKIVSTFKVAIQEKKIAKYLIQENRDIFSLSYSQTGVPLLLEKMKVIMANKTNETDAKKRRG